MPITAKLSRQFYEKLGDEVTNELVTWLNAVDDSYRQEFRDLFAANFGQLRAEIDARLTQLRAEMDAKLTQLRAEMDAGLAQLHAEMDAGLAQLSAEMDAKLAQLRVEMHAIHASVLRWMFVFWVGQVAVTIGAIVAARQLLR